MATKQKDGNKKADLLIAAGVGALMSFAVSYLTHVARLPAWQQIAAPLLASFAAYTVIRILQERGNDANHQ